MPVRIRLQRRGRKRHAIYSIVVADGRAPRDGKYIEKIGQYNPNQNPAAIILDFDRTIYWLGVGAQPSDTCNNILQREGVLYKRHLLRGLKKGALTAEQVETQFSAWKAQKDAKVSASVNKLRDADKKLAESKFEAEKKVNETRLETFAKERAKLLKGEEEAKKEAEKVVEVEAEKVVEEKKEENAE